MAKPVGFDQKIKLQHLDYIAREVSGTERKQMYEKLDEYLMGDIRGSKARKNSITMLMKIWFLVPDEFIELRQRAQKLLQVLDSQDRLVLHWGMVLLAYPFFKDVASELGNLFSLQHEVPSQQIGRKMKGLYGDRRRVEVATTAALMSIKAWGIVDRSNNNIYTLREKHEITNTSLKLWLAEVVLRVSDYQYIPMELIATAQAIFPFKLSINMNELQSSTLRVNRQGLDMLLVGL